MVDTRRRFLKSGVALGGSLVFGCSSRALEQPQSDGAAGAGSDVPDDDLVDRGSLLGELPFVDESTSPLDTPFNRGLDGRLYTDLSVLEPGELLIPNEAFYIRTRYPDLLRPEPPWRIALDGAVETPTEVSLDELLPLEVAQGAVLLECSGNARGAAFGLLSSAEWHGIPLAAVLDRVVPLASATRVLVSGFDEHSQPSANGQSQPGASWVFSFAELERTGAFLATRMNGQALPPDHGAPVRLIVPGWYGCTCIKWVNQVTLVTDDQVSTDQMREFATRTQQLGTPELARDFLPAEIDVAAMPIRIERWQLDGRVVHRVVGIVWGGSTRAPALEIQFGSGPWQAVTDYTPPSDTRSWSLWSTRWEPTSAGTYAIVLRVPDRSVRTRRLDRSYYLREVAVDSIA